MTSSEWAKAAAAATVIASVVGIGGYYSGWKSHVSAEAVQAKTVDDDHQILATMAPKVDASISLGAVQTEQILGLRREQAELHQDVRDLIASQRELNDKVGLLIQSYMREGKIAR